MPWNGWRVITAVASSTRRGKITIDNPEAAAAIATAAGWIDTISPEGVLNYAEEEARGVFQSGNAVFMRNWPYAWSLAQGPESVIRIASAWSALPRAARTDTLPPRWAARNSPSPTSKHPQLAADLVPYLTGAQEQKRRRHPGRLQPNPHRALSDPEVLAAAPFMGAQATPSVNAVGVHPPSPASSTTRSATNSGTPSTQCSPARSRLVASLAQLERSLKRLSRGGRHW